MGIRVQSATDWLFDRLFEGSARPVPFDYSNPDPTYHNPGSVNMERLFDSCGYVAGVPGGRARLLDGYKIEARDGHGGGEILTPSHAPLHLAAHGADLLHAHRTGDEEVQELAIDWLRAEHGFLLPCMVEREVVRKGKNGRGDRRVKILDAWTAGARAVQDGIVNGFNTSEGRAQFMAAVRGEEPRRSKTYVGALCVAAVPSSLRERIATRPKKSEWPPAHGGLHIASYPSGEFYCYFDSLEVLEGGTRAAGLLGLNLWIERGGDMDKIASYQGKPDILIEPPLPVGRPDRPERRPRRGGRGAAAGNGESGS